MRHATIFDCEFLTAEGALSRLWSGPDDPDPVVAQIGMIRLGLEADFPLMDQRRLYVLPLGRDGARLPLDPYFTALTGVTEADLDREGMPLAEALAEVGRFAGDTRLWCWGKDEFNMVAISCYVQGITPALPVGRFGNATRLMLAAGMPREDLRRTSSGKLADYFGLPHGPLRGHDALDDATSIALVLRHLLAQGKLRPEDLD